MPANKQIPDEPWAPRQAVFLVTACLVAGLASGGLLRSWNNPPQGPTQSGYRAAAGGTGNNASFATGDGAALPHMADANAAPLLRQLQSDPGNPDLLASLGNLYYDAGQYTTAIDYYARALKARPSDADVRTDLGTAWWYLGDSDAAIAQFTQALASRPNNPNTLFNLGIVLWRGKGDAAGAIAEWNKLLATNPPYERRREVEMLISDAQNQKK